jgi:outer membrane autotransporter protein
MKILAILPAALFAAAPAAFAGPYVNVEANSGYTGNDYSGTVIDNHVGYEGNNWYIQAGPAVVLSDAAESELELSGKVGGTTSLSERLDLYGEVSFLTGDNDTSYGTKAGLKYSF